MTASYDDLTIDDLLGDPMTLTIMKADRVDPSELEAMLRALAPHVARATGRSSDDALDVECAPFDRNAVGRFLRSMFRGRGETSRRVATRSSVRSELCRAP
jgi:hypothetical protein